MFTEIKNWFVEAISNGGVIVVLLVAVVVGGVGEVVQPVSLVHDAFSGSPAPAAPIDPTLIRLDAGDGWTCPDLTWIRTTGGGSTIGPGFVSCKKQGIEIRHFVRTAGNMTDPDQAIDTNTYPQKFITIEEAIQRTR